MTTFLINFLLIGIIILDVTWILRDEINEIMEVIL